MTYGFHIITCLLLLICQTVVLPDLPLLANNVDLAAVFVIYYSLLRPLRESLPLVMVLGLLLDCLSGTPFLLFTSAYFWTLFAVRTLAGVLQVGMRFRLAVIVLVGSLVSNLIFFLAMGGLAEGGQLPPIALRSMLTRSFWALLFGPPMILLLGRMQDWWDRRFGSHAERRPNGADVRSAG
jgi:cell shape-determining protein MreD